MAAKGNKPKGGGGGWFKPNFWTLAYLDEASGSKSADRPIDKKGCFNTLGCLFLLAMFIFGCFIGCSLFG